MKRCLTMLLILCATTCFASEDGPHLAPDGTYVGGKPILTPDGTYIGDGTY